MGGGDPATQGTYTSVSSAGELAQFASTCGITNNVSLHTTKGTYGFNLRSGGPNRTLTVRDFIPSWPQSI